MDDVEAIRGLLATIEAEPTLLPALPGVRPHNRGEMLYRRVADEVHPCLKCGERATAAFLVKQSLDGTWRALDVCSGCAVLVVAVIHGLENAFVEHHEGDEDEGDDEGGW
jgi:hypothetical protein